MNHLKEVNRIDGVCNFLTYADNFAVGYFKKQVNFIYIFIYCILYLIIYYLFLTLFIFYFCLFIFHDYFSY